MTDQDRDKLRELIDGFEQAMLVTHAADGSLHSRPMRIVANRPKGTLVFVTHKDAPKVEEIARDDRVAVVMQDGQRHVAVSGRARLDLDPDRIGRYYDSSWQVWFPEGLKDPNIALLDVEPESAEYWDGGGWNRVKLAVASARALLNEEALDADVTDHAKVRMPR